MAKNKESMWSKENRSEISKAIGFFVQIFNDANIRSMIRLALFNKGPVHANPIENRARKGFRQ